MTEVRERIEKLGDFFEETAAASEQAGKLTDDVVEKLKWVGVVRMLQPKEFGGDEAHPVEFFEAVLDLGSRNGATGWVASVVGVHPWEFAQADLSIQEEIWGEDPDTWTASPYAPMGRLTKVDGGYIANGRWSFSSGTDHCQWIILGAVIVDEGSAAPGANGGHGTQVHIVLPRSDYEIVDGSWSVIGLEGTGSKDILIKDTFIPERRIVRPDSLADTLAERGRDNALYRMPFSVMFSGAIACGSLAIAEGALRTFTEYAASRVDSKGSAASSNPHQLVALAEAAADISASRLQFLDDIHQIYRLAEKGADIPAAARLQVRRNQVRAVRRATTAVDQLFVHGGGAALRRDQPFQRFFRDMHAAQNHANNAAELTYEGWGRNLFGLSVPPGVRF